MKVTSPVTLHCRLSVAPETSIARHSVVAPLPPQPRVATVEFAPDSAVAEIESQPHHSPPRRGRKRKGEMKEADSDSSKDKARAAIVTKEATETSAQTGTKVEERQERHAVNSKVFAR